MRPIPGRRRRHMPVRPRRLVVGAGLIAAAGLGFTALVVDAGRRDGVLAVRRDVPAGAALTADDLTVVELGSDGVAAIAAGDLDEVVGQYARFAISGGSVLVPAALQPSPLVSPGRVLMAVPVSEGELPGGLVPGDDVLIVVTPPLTCPVVAPVVVAGVVAATPEAAEAPEARDRSRPLALSVEVPADRVITVAGGESFVVARPNAPLPPLGPSGDQLAACPTVTNHAPAGAPGAPASPASTAPTAPAPTGVVPLVPDDVLLPPATIG